MQIVIGYILQLEHNYSKIKEKNSRRNSQTCEAKALKLIIGPAM